jgi:hypothetical protein
LLNILTVAEDTQNWSKKQRMTAGTQLGEGPSQQVQCMVTEAAGPQSILKGNVPGHHWLLSKSVSLHKCSYDGNKSGRGI